MVHQKTLDQALHLLRLLLSSSIAVAEPPTLLPQVHKLKRVDLTRGR